MPVIPAPEPPWEPEDIEFEALLSYIVGREGQGEMQISRTLKS